MYSVLAVSAICLGALLFVITILAARHPRQTGWRSESLVAGIYVPGIIGFVLLGLALTVQLIISEGPAADSAQIGWCVGVAVVTVVAIAMMRVRRRLAEYRRPAPSATGTPMPPSAPTRTSGSRRPKAA